MPLFTPVKQLSDLPAPTTSTRASEGHWLDFKNSYSPSNHAEMAKDMAAFANALGGAIIVGTSKDSEPLDYRGLDANFAEQLSNEFDLAHRDDLSPKPLIERYLLPCAMPSKKVLLAVNVHPYPEQVVGARVVGNWRFPVRVGAQTSYLTPAVLPAFNSQARRAAILLERIELGATIELILVNTAGIISYSGPRTYLGLDYDRNVLKLEERNGIAHTKKDWHPLDQVFTVYQGADDQWRVKVRC